MPQTISDCIASPLICRRIFRVWAVGFSLCWMTMAGCLFVQVDQSDPPPTPQALSPKPEIAMSDELVHSKSGDMIAFLPQGWYFLDPTIIASNDVYALAVNPTMTLSCVFSSLRRQPSQDSLTTHQGLYALARNAMARHRQKTAGAAQLVGKYGLLQVGSRSFGSFNFSSPESGLVNRCAVFISSMGNYYQFSIAPLSTTLEPQTSEEEVQKIFRSILATIEY